MSTGYTYKIESGEIKKPKDFVHLCLRAFGVMTHMIEDSLDAPDKIDWDNMLKDKLDYPVRCLNKAKEELLRYQNMSDDEKQQMKEEYRQTLKKDLKRVEASLRNTKEMNDTYDSFISKINQWQCSPVFDKIKKFAIEQCDMSKDDLMYPLKDLKFIKEQLANIDEYTESHIQYLIEWNEREIKDRQEEIERIKKEIEHKKEFYEQFMKEIENIPE